MNWRGRFESSSIEGPHRPTFPKAQPQEYPVTIEIEGKRYTGFYTVSSGVVTVESDWGERSTQAGPRVAEQTARSLLLEILRRAKSRGALDVKVAAKKGVKPAAPLLSSPGPVPWIYQSEIENPRPPPAGYKFAKQKADQEIPFYVDR
jgi:hypothetical protein